MALQETPNSDAVRRLNGGRKGTLQRLANGPAQRDTATHGTDQRSRVTNGKSPFVETDQRGAWARRWRDIHGQIISDLGGADLLSEGQRQLIRRATTISIQCELLEGRIAKGEAVDDQSIEMYGKLTDRLGRCFHRLGLKRQAKDVPLSLNEYLRRPQREAAE